MNKNYDILNALSLIEGEKHKITLSSGGKKPKYLSSLRGGTTKQSHELKQFCSHFAFTALLPLLDYFAFARNDAQFILSLKKDTSKEICLNLLNLLYRAFRSTHVPKPLKNHIHHNN